MMKYMTMAKGRPMTTVAFWTVSTPLICKRTMVRTPTSTAQKMRDQMGPSWRESVTLEVKLDITSAPESAEVMYSSRPTIVDRPIRKVAPGEDASRS